MKITGKELIEKYDHLNEHGLVDQIREKRLTAINPISHEEVDWLEDEKLFNEVKRMAEKPLPPKTRGPNPYTEGQGLFVPIKDKPRHRLRVTQGAEDMSWFELHSRLMNKECNIPISRETWGLLRQDYGPGHQVETALRALYNIEEATLSLSSKKKVFSSQEDPIADSRNHTTYLNIIGLLLEIIKGEFPGIERKHPDFTTQAALIKKMAETKLYGTSHKKLDEILANANKNVKSVD